MYSNSLTNEKVINILYGENKYYDFEFYYVANLPSFGKINYNTINHYPNNN